MKEGLVLALLCLSFWAHTAHSGCASNYFVVNDLHESTTEGQTKSVSFSVNGEHYAFDGMTRTNPVKATHTTARQIEINTPYDFCPQSFLARTWAGRNGEYDLRVYVDDRSMRGAVLKEGGIEHVLTPANEIDAKCLPNSITTRSDFSSLLLAYSPSENPQYARLRRADDVALDLIHHRNEEEDLGILFQARSHETSSENAASTVPRNCPEPVVLSVGIVGHWSFRQLFTSSEAACVEIANVINTVSGVFERTVNTQLRLDLAFVMTQSSNVGASPLEAWNGQPCLSTQEQLSSFTSWANESLDYVSVAQLFTGCGAQSHLAWVGSVCNSEYLGGGVAKYDKANNSTFPYLVSHNFGHMLGASNDDTGIMASSSTTDLYFSRKSQSEMCTVLQRQSPTCLVPRDCVLGDVNGTVTQCGVSCGQYNSFCDDGFICQDHKCVTNLTCSPWCEKKGYTCGPDGCGGQCGEVDLTTAKAACLNGQLKTTLINSIDVANHIHFLVNTERSSYGLAALKWDNNLMDKQMRNAAVCSWDRVLWVGDRTGHYALQSEFAVAIEPSGLLNLPRLVASDLFNTNWLCGSDSCAGGHCERYRLYIHGNLTGFSCYSQSCSGASNPYSTGKDWSFVLCGFVGDVVAHHPLANDDGTLDVTKCTRRGNLTGKCTPRTCDNYQYQCGEFDDGCGGVLNCGECPLGSNCGADGQCECEPIATCDDGFELQCGFLWNGCEYVECSCPSSTIVNAIECQIVDEQLSGNCVCDAQAVCQQNGPETPSCGNYTTPCGEKVDCGTCGEGVCVDGTCMCENECKTGDTCYTKRDCFGEILCPTTTPCGTDKNNCGLVADKCGVLQYCGECSGDNEYCINNKCTCVASTTCQTLDRHCGSFVDECGVTQQCGSCLAGQVCGDSVDGSAQCLCEAKQYCLQNNAECGFVSSPCGDEFCGSCGKNVCNSTTHQCEPPLSCVPNANACANVECGLVFNGCEMVLCENSCRAPTETCVENTCVCDSDLICKGRECGEYENQCNNKYYSCGDCSAYQSDRFTCKDFQCVCEPATCDGRDGVFDDGCGGVIHCGANPNKPPCIPRNITCDSLGVTCGRYATGCNDEYLECSDCPLSAGGAVQYCVNGQCACIPHTCDRIGKSCGTWSDGCGSQINCGACSGQTTCTTTGSCACVSLTNVCDGKCGVVFDGCEYVTCSPCLEPYSCLYDLEKEYMTCVNTTCENGQVWDSFNSECRCPYGFEWDDDSNSCDLIPDDFFDYCFSNHWTMARGRWLTFGQAREGQEFYNCSTVLSSLDFNSRSVITPRDVPITSPPQLNTNFFVTLPVRAEPSTFQFTTGFQWDIRSSIFGIAALVGDIEGSYIYFIWNYNTGAWELGLTATNGSGSVYAIATLPFDAPIQGEIKRMSLRVYRGYSVCAIEQPYVGWLFTPVLNGVSAGPYCFNELPELLVDSYFSPDDSLPFALIDDGYTRFYNPRRFSHTQVQVTFWGCFQETEFHHSVANALSIPLLAITNIQIDNTQGCPSGVAQRTEVKFELTGGPWGTSSGLASAFLEMVNANLFTYPRHHSFIATQTAVEDAVVPTQVALTASSAGVISMTILCLLFGLIVQLFV